MFARITIKKQPLQFQRSALFYHMPDVMHQLLCSAWSRFFCLLMRMMAVFGVAAIISKNEKQTKKGVLIKNVLKPDDDDDALFIQYNIIIIILIIILIIWVSKVLQRAQKIHSCKYAYQLEQYVLPIIIITIIIILFRSLMFPRFYIYYYLYISSSSST